MTKDKAAIVQWVQDYSAPLDAKEDLEKFAAALNEQISQMDFRAVKI